MANDMNRWNNAAGFNMHELFNDEGISSIDNKNGYLNIELSGRHQLQAALDSLGVSMFGNSDLFLHGFRSTDFVTNTKEATDLIVKHPNVFIDYEITKGKMDDVFLNVTGRNISDISN